MVKNNGLGWYAINAATELLLIDEPVAGIDEKETRSTANLLKKFLMIERF